MTAAAAVVTGDCCMCMAQTSKGPPIMLALSKWQAWCMPVSFGRSPLVAVSLSAVRRDAIHKTSSTYYCCGWYSYTCRCSPSGANDEARQHHRLLLRHPPPSRRGGHLADTHSQGALITIWYHCYCCSCRCVRRWCLLCCASVHFFVG